MGDTVKQNNFKNNNVKNRFLETVFKIKYLVINISQFLIYFKLGTEKGFNIYFSITSDFFLVL